MGSGFTVLLGNLKFVRAEALVKEEADTSVQEAWLRGPRGLIIIGFTFQKITG